MSDIPIINVPEGERATLSLEGISRVGVHNVIDLLSHRVMRSGDLTVHEFEFHGGGHVKLAYRESGKLEEFQTTKMRVAVRNHTEVILVGTASAGDEGAFPE